jgi:serine/threonine protein kinase
MQARGGISGGLQQDGAIRPSSATVHLLIAVYSQWAGRRELLRPSAEPGSLNTKPLIARVIPFSWPASRILHDNRVALTPGARLGPYDIVAQIGEGGMGQVYRAHDTKLNRDVALKVLPDAFANDSDRLARFTREAQTLASLNHPHIAAIYGLEESDGVRAIVMELVEGEDLSQRIARGPVPLDEALPVAKQIAEALEAPTNRASSTAT